MNKKLNMKRAIPTMANSHSLSFYTSLSSFFPDPLLALFVFVSLFFFFLFRSMTSLSLSRCLFLFKFWICDLVFMFKYEQLMVVAMGLGHGVVQLPICFWGCLRALRALLQCFFSLHGHHGQTLASRLRSCFLHSSSEGEISFWGPSAWDNRKPIYG